MRRPRFDEHKSEGRSCRKKTRFRDEFSAKRAARQYGMRSYDCRFCGGWHLTSRKWIGNG